MTAGQHIDYEALAQEAMRGVVRAVLVTVAETGLVGDHHFYIAFNTHAPGVNVSKRLKEKYPVEMTIVLQHRFWDLEVNDERFEVKLTFDGVPERLVVPFQAVKVFYDPSVPYGLQFEESELMTDQGRKPPSQRRRDDAAATEESPPGFHASEIDRTDKRRSTRRTRPEKIDAQREAKPALVQAEADEASKLAVLQKPVQSVPATGKPVLAEVKSADDTPKPDASGAKVVDLSKFRKK